MRVEFSPPDITEEEIQEVAEALRSGWITTGPAHEEIRARDCPPCAEQKKRSASDQRLRVWR